MTSRAQRLHAAVRQWVATAEDDYALIRHNLETGFDRHWITTFHAQQAVEEFIKALLLRHQVHFEPIHEIARLRETVRGVDPALAEALKPADALTRYALRGRYPPKGYRTVEQVGERDAQRAVEIAHQVRSLVLERLSPYLEQSQ